MIKRTAAIVLAASGAVCLAGQTNNILITGYWPPTNEMVRQFSTNAAQNPGGWQGGNWEGRGFNIYSHFSEFPGGTTVNPWGTGDFEVDYQGTSADWTRITDMYKPVAIITFSRANSVREWELEPASQRFRNPGETNPPGRNIPQYVSDGRDVLYPTNTPMAAEPVGRIRNNSLPMQQIVNAVQAVYPSTGTIAPRIAPYNPSTPDTYDFGGSYLSGYIGYHGIWYYDEHSAPGTPFRTFAAGHIHVGQGLALDVAKGATEISLRTLIDYITPLLPRKGDANIDGVVNISDFAALASNFNEQTGQVWEDGDFTYDNAVTISDFALLAGNFNTGARTSVPEPAASALVLIALALRARRRR